jgi:hypothetical protein
LACGSSDCADCAAAIAGKQSAAKIAQMAAGRTRVFTMPETIYEGCDTLAVLCGSAAWPSPWIA